MVKLPYKKILVTGGAGFIGSHLVESLVLQGISVVVPYLSIKTNSYFKLKNLGKKVITVKLDINDKNKVHHLITDEKIDFIFHLAAKTIVTESYIDPYLTLKTNIMGTVNLLESVRLVNKIKGIIVASSDKAYGKTTEKYTEAHPLKGDHPYDVSKSSADLISQMYFRTYGLPVVVTRFGNVYGEGDLHLDRIVPGICEAIVKRIELQIRSDGTFVRDYLYVQDVVDGYIFLMENFDRTIGQAYNFSSPDTYSVLQLIASAEKALGINIPCTIKNNAVNEIPYQHLSDKKIRKLGWRTGHTFSKTIPGILKWYRNVLQ